MTAKKHVITVNYWGLKWSRAETRETLSLIIMENSLQSESYVKMLRKTAKLDVADAALALAPRDCRICSSVRRCRYWRMKRDCFPLVSPSAAAAPVVLCSAGDEVGPAALEAEAASRAARRWATRRIVVARSSCSRKWSPSRFAADTCIVMRCFRVAFSPASRSCRCVHWKPAKAKAKSSNTGLLGAKVELYARFGYFDNWLLVKLMRNKQEESRMQKPLRYLMLQSSSRHLAFERDLNSDRGSAAAIGCMFRWSAARRACRRSRNSIHPSVKPAFRFPRPRRFLNTTLPSAVTSTAKPFRNVQCSRKKIKILIDIASNIKI